MITARSLIKLLETLPDDAEIYAYEGEGIGLVVRLRDGEYKWINACDSDEEEEQDEF